MERGRRVLDLSTGRNPIPPGHDCIEEAASALWAANEYGARNGEPLRSALAQHFGVESERIHINAGSELILRNLVRLFGDRTHLITPTYGLLYSLVGAVTETRLNEALGFALEDRDLYPPADATLVVITNPNNPSGVKHDLSHLPEIARSRPHTVFVVDEAWLLPGESSMLDLTPVPNIVIVRTFSKAYGLAGCRVGFAIADPNIVAKLNQLSDVFPTAASSLAAAVAVLRRTDRLAESVDCLRQWTLSLAADLKRFGARVSQSDSYIVAATFPSISIGDLVAHLRSQDVWLSELKEEWLRQHTIRIPTSHPNDNQRLIRLIGEFIDKSRCTRESARYDKPLLPANVAGCDPSSIGLCRIVPDKSKLGSLRLNGLTEGSIRFVSPKPDDLDLYNRLLSASWTQHAEVGSTPPLLDTTSFALRNELGHLYLLERLGVGIGGVVVGTDDDRRELYVELLFLVPEAQSTGGFRDALRPIFRAGHMLGLRCVHFHTNEALRGNRMLYRLMGAREMNRTDGGGWTRVHYVLDLPYRSRALRNLS